MSEELIEARGNLLVVDDLADNLRVLSNTLSNHGYRVRCVRNGAMAIVGAKAAPPDVILLDIRMPEMDGYEVCRRLKADPITQPIPIIFLSALDETLDKSKAFEVGGVDYITKPFQIEEVLARVHHQLTIQKLKQQVAAQQQQLQQATPIGSGKSERTNTIDDDISSTIATILACTTRLSQSSALDSEQYTALRVIHQNAQILLDLIGK